MKELNRDELLKVKGGESYPDFIWVPGTLEDVSNGYCYGQPEDPNGVKGFTVEIEGIVRVKGGDQG